MKKYYEIIVCKKGIAKYTDFEVKYGPILLKKRMEAFMEHYKAKARMLNEIINNVSSLEIKEEKEKELLQINKYILKTE